MNNFLFFSALIIVIAYAVFSIGVSSITPTTEINSPNTEIKQIQGKTSKILNVPYINQFLNEDNSYGPSMPTGNGKLAGTQMCGAASSSMVAAYYGKIPNTNYSTLKESTFLNKGLDLPTYCANEKIYGTFGVTSKGTGCTYNSDIGMIEYFSRIGITMATNWAPLKLDTVKQQIDNNNPLIIVFCLPPPSAVCHIAVLIGYTEDGYMVVHDPWTDLSKGDRSFSKSGKEAIYNINTAPFANFIGYIYRVN